ncbi:redoxin domain-containing protein [Chitinophaga vietnamensis]|uniref:redoxin domain-containing protein n=1 Tax=Chitinophaga vietnamensis TaxID=2593957 RepID=UPI001177F51F|nr:redoxin domain-containing protein [Chitinophaga vietnamensis]
MIKLVLYLSCCTLLFTAFQPAREDALELGSLIPKADIRCTDISGKELSLNDARGANGLLVIFVANRCPYMQRNQERLHAACSLARKHNIGIAMINSNEAARVEGESLTAMKEYAAKQQYNCYYLLDHNAELADAFDANHTPECFLFDKNSRLVYKGAIDDSPGNADAVKAKLLLNALNDVAAGKAVAVGSSNALGCNIKRKL